MASTVVSAPPPQRLLMDPNDLDAARALLGVSPAQSSEEGSFTFSTEEFPFRKRQRSDSAGLDALADIAFAEQKADAKKKSLQVTFEDSVTAPAITASSSSEDEDESHMPPPPPRFRRRRSSSNPEGMEKWDSLGPSKTNTRRHFVLPASILESELAEASAAVMEQERRLPEKENQKDGHEKEEEEVDESTLTPDELLRRARSRLLEDLSEGTVNGEKGVLTLPHALSKYKEVYNKNGRIGIYTASERAAIIARFHRKRGRRVWNKKIRYNCRKSLADRRLRVKGRFVKRSEQEQLRKMLAEKESKNGNTQEADDDMPPVDDPEAGFAPTEDQPFRRVRRFTIA